MSVILGNSTDHTSAGAGDVNRRWSAKFNLASAGIMNELHAWVDNDTVSCDFIIHLYADNSNAPGARLAYTSPITLAGSTPTGSHEISQSGFAVSLSAGDYWLGVQGTSANWFPRLAGGGASTFHTIIKGSAAFNPPDDPYGSFTDLGNGTAISTWAVLADPVTFVPQILSM